MVLTVLAIVLGYLIWLQPPPVTPGAQEKEVLSISSEEERVLQTPGPDATEEERRTHFELALRLATRTDFLDISACKVVEPVVFKVVERETFTVRNDDDIEHVMIIDEEHIYPVPAKGTLELVADFGNNTGLYGYGCDDVPQAVGLILVEPAELEQ